MCGQHPRVGVMWWSTQKAELFSCDSSWIKAPIPFVSINFFNTLTWDGDLSYIDVLHRILSPYLHTEECILHIHEGIRKFWYSFHLPFPKLENDGHWENVIPVGYCTWSSSIWFYQQIIMLVHQQAKRSISPMSAIVKTIFLVLITWNEYPEHTTYRNIGIILTYLFWPSVPI